jgi:hypothetical protein
MLNWLGYHHGSATIQPPATDVPYWTECTAARDCNTCGRDIWIGERCVISGPTIHCRLCGPRVSRHEDTGVIE